MTEECKCEIAKLPWATTGPLPVIGDGLYQITRERMRQQVYEGYTDEHDDAHTNGELGQAAAYYADPDMEEWYEGHVEWPWGNHKGPREGEIHYGRFPSPDDRIKHLIKAGALCAAEIDRLLRLRKKEENK